MGRLVIVVILAVCALPLNAWAQQPDMAKLKADAQRVISIISHDKAKTQTYCQINDLNEQIDREKDETKAGVLSKKIDELEKQLGPEYLAFVESTQDLDPDSKDGLDIISLFDELDASCPH